MSVTWRVRALLDVRRVVDFLARENGPAARRLNRELLLAADSLTLFPRRGRPGMVPGTRELWTVGPYVLVYRTDHEGAVTILRVWHAAQNRSDRA